MNTDPLPPYSLHNRCLLYQVRSSVFALPEQQVNAVRAGSGELSFLSILPVPWVWQLKAQKGKMSPPKAIVYKDRVARSNLGRTAENWTLSSRDCSDQLCICHFVWCWNAHVGGWVNTTETWEVKCYTNIPAVSAILMYTFVFSFWNSIQSLPTSTGN